MRCATPSAKEAQCQISARTRKGKRQTEVEMDEQVTERSDRDAMHGGKRVVGRLCTRLLICRELYCRRIVGSVMVRIGFERNELWLKKVFTIAFLSLMDGLEPIHSRREHRAR